MTDPTDAQRRGAVLDQQLIVVAEKAVFYRKTVLLGFALQVSILLLILAGVVGITLDTNQSVKNQVVPLQKRVTELESTVADQESIITQQTDAIVLLITTLQENGINPPEIIIRPPED